MNYEVENEDLSLPDDVPVLDGLTEETEELPSIDEVLTTETDETPVTEESTPEETTEPEPEHVTKPQSMKVRMEAYETKGYKRGKEEAQAAWSKEKADYEQRLAKLQELELRDEAQTLARQEHISEAIAMRLIRAEKGIPAPTQTTQTEQPARDEKGRFVAQKAPDNDARVQELYRDATAIEDATGINVGQLLDAATDADKDALLAGKMSMGEYVRKTQKKTPQTVRNTNSAPQGATTIGGMSDKAFEALSRSLESGKKYRLT